MLREVKGLAQGHTAQGKGTGGLNPGPLGFNLCWSPSVLPLCPSPLQPDRMHGYLQVNSEGEKKQNKIKARGFCRKQLEAGMSIKITTYIQGNP